MEFKFAISAGKDTLYKFRAFRTTEQKARVREILTQHKIYFSRRSQLNDPFDLAPVISLNRSQGEAALRSQLMAAVPEFITSRYSNEHQAEILAYLSSGNLEMLEASGRQKILARLERDYWVFSLAGNRKHAMMWSHYGDGHSGLCIHFLAHEHSVFGTSLSVVYEDDRPTVSFPILDETDLMQKATLWKGRFWSYEDEYRLVRYPRTTYNGPLIFEGQHAQFDSRLIVGITVGACMASQEVAEIRELAAHHSPELPVWQAMTTLTYDLDFRHL